MVLFVREGCKFCDQFKDVAGLVIARVKMTPRGLKADIGGQLIDPPVRLPGFPALLDGNQVYVGKSVIEQRLKKT